MVRLSVAADVHAPRGPRVQSLIQGHLAESETAAIAEEAPTSDSPSETPIEKTSETTTDWCGAQPKTRQQGKAKAMVREHFSVLEIFPQCISETNPLTCVYKFPFCFAE